MALPTRPEQQSFEATYISGHSAFPKQMKVHLTLFPDCIEIPEFPERIPYDRIKKVQSITKEELSKKRLLLVGIFAFAWKKKKLYMQLTYLDDVNIEQNPVFDVEEIEEVQPAIYQMMSHPHPSPNAIAPPSTPHPRPGGFTPAPPPPSTVPPPKPRGMPSPLPPAPTRMRAIRVGLKKLPNLLRLVGGLIILVSNFLPFYITGGKSLGVMVTTLLGNINLGQTLSINLFLMITGFFLLLIGGIVAIFKGNIGGLLCLLALILLSVHPYYLFEGFDWFPLMGLGYYGPVFGIVLILIARIIGWRWKKNE